MSEPEFNREQFIKDVSLIMKDLLKVIKVVSLYPESNPLPQSLRRSFAEKLVNIIEDYGEIRINVEKECLNFENEVVFKDSSKEERLAGIFFDTGITNFTFRQSLDVLEVYKLLDVIKAYMNIVDGSADLAAMIWEAAIDGFGFGTVEDIALSQYDESFDIQAFVKSADSEFTGQGQFGVEVADYDTIFDHLASGADYADSEGGAVYAENNEIDLDEDSQPGPRIFVKGSGGRPVPGGQRGGGTPIKGSKGGGGASGGRSQFYAVTPGIDINDPFDEEGVDVGKMRTAEAAKAMGLTNLNSARPMPDTTLILNDEFKLSEEEEDEIARLIKIDQEFDEYESTVALLKEMLHQEVEMQPFNETVTICEKVIGEFISHGRLIESAQLLSYLKELSEKIGKKKPLWAERLKEAVVMAGSRDRLAILSEALNRYDDIGTREINKYLSIFGWEALSSITDLLGVLHNKPHREALCNYLTTRGKKHLNIVSKGLYDKNPDVVCNSITVLSQIGDDKALDQLAKTVDHDDNDVRSHLVESLIECRDDRALDLLVQLARDSLASIRTAAVNAIVARRGKAAFEAIGELVGQEQLQLLTEDDQRALLKAYSVLGGDAAVSYLSSLITKYNLFHERSLGLIRQAAFEALSHNRSEKGERALVSLSSNWRPDIKNQAKAAIQKRREIIYGGEG